jgi:hypothetical protein
LFTWGLRSASTTAMFPAGCSNLSTAGCADPLAIPALLYWHPLYCKLVLPKPSHCFLRALLLSFHKLRMRKQLQE